MMGNHADVLIFQSRFVLELQIRNCNVEYGIWLAAIAKLRCGGMYGGKYG